MARAAAAARPCRGCSATPTASWPPSRSASPFAGLLLRGLRCQHAVRAARRLAEGRGSAEGLAGTLALVLVTIAISYLSLVVGELTPKRLALQRAEGFALLVAAPLNPIATLSRPVIWLLSKSTNVLVRLLGGDPKLSGESISQEELRDLVAAHESLSSDERRLIDEVFRAGEREVREVMTPRTEVAFLDASMTASRAAKLVADSNWSRFPVAGRDQDDVVGFVHVRDLFLPNHPAGRAATVGDLAREVKRLPGTEGVLAALSEMRRENQHLAIVVDEYGGTDGIVTLEDLIEEVIGEIYDEYDEEVAPDGKQPPGGPARGRRAAQPRRLHRGHRARAARRALRDGRRLRARRARPAAGGRRHRRGRGPHDPPSSSSTDGGSPACCRARRRHPTPDDENERTERDGRRAGSARGRDRPRRRGRCPAGRCASASSPGRRGCGRSRRPAARGRRPAAHRPRPAPGGRSPRGRRRRPPAPRSPCRCPGCRSGARPRPARAGPAGGRRRGPRRGRSRGCRCRPGVG